MTRTLAIGLACAAAFVAGCGGGDSPSATTGGAAPAAPPPEPNTIVMGEFSYSPMTLTVTAGTPITFRNDGKIEHTVADVDAAGEIRSRFIKPTPLATGATQIVTFRTPGTYDYICTFHPTLMHGTIIVR